MSIERGKIIFILFFFIELTISNFVVNQAGKKISNHYESIMKLTSTSSKNYKTRLT